jgi:hypothetical protein
MHEMLAQEPWCGWPTDIAMLTDWQIENLYAGPAIERAQERDKEFKQGVHDQPFEDTMNNDHQKTEPPPTDSPKFREWVITQFMLMGMSRATAEAQYEEQAKA